MNKKGITLISLVVTIIVMVILLSVGGSVSLQLIRKGKEQSLVTDMLLIQTKVKIIMERANFNSDTSIYIGIKLKDNENKTNIAGEALTSEELEKDSIYIYDETTLVSIGLSSIDLNSGDVFLVDYSNSDIIFPKGCKREDGSTFYRLSQIYTELQSYTQSYIPVVTFETGSDFIQAEVFAKAEVSKYQFVIGTSRDSVNQLEGVWQTESTFKFESLESDTSYYVRVKTLNVDGNEQESQVYKVRTK